jgi:Pentapeptide repeats (8 copies)
MTAEQIKQVIDLHAKWLRSEEGGQRADLESANLEGANLRSADLEGANLQSANLRSANLRSANLRSANLEGADLEGANLQSANLRSANLESANLESANLRSANLESANLESANLESANLRSANLESANLESANLRSANLRSAEKGIPITPMSDIKSEVLKRIESSSSCKINMNHWHTCDTVHCLAGWIVTVHPEGKMLEHFTSPAFAATVILQACGIKPPNFYDTAAGCNERAMNWLRTGQQVDPVTV